MKHTNKKSLVYVLVLTAILFWTAGSALGVILHPDGEPNLVTWTDRPPDDVVGRWRSNASCVVVSSNCVITVRHAGSSVNALVEIAGEQYTVSEVWDHNTADLRIAKLYGANLANFVDIYENTNEVGRYFVVGGYGDGRDGLLETQGMTYGYQWDNSSNTTLRFGTNRIQGVQTDSTLEGFTSDIIIAYFDGLSEGISTVYESTPADHDSGSGWFVKTGGIWKVAGLSRAVEVHYKAGHEDDPNYAIYDQSWFRDSNDPNVLHPDYFDAVRISSYAQWLRDTLPQAGDLNGDDDVDFTDFSVFALYWLSSDCQAPSWCHGADLEPDGSVNWADLAKFATYWHTSNSD